MCGGAYYQAELLSVWIQAILYGFYVFLFIRCVHVCTSVRPNKNFLALTIVIFALCTAQLILEFVAVILTPVVVSGCMDSTVTPQEIAHQSNIQNVMNVVLQFLWTTNQALADGLLIYRAYGILRSFRWIILFPSVLMLATAVIGYVNFWITYEVYIIAVESQASSPLPPPRWFHFNQLDQSFNLAFFSLATATTIIVTLLIVGQIWWVAREMNTTLGSPVTKKYRNIVAMLSESGAAFALSLVLYLIVTEVAPTWNAIFFSVAIQVAGIAPTLIIVRVGQSQAAEQTTMEPRNVRVALPSGSHHMVFAKPHSGMQSQNTSEAPGFGRTWPSDVEAVRGEHDSQDTSPAIPPKLEQC
ncbi:hypothetical protein JAAARDRAFT_62112 [Jaapia argillacea MUCL 33604]|uniref:Uncharacterized protein n=1 Tax=Jaapia argillacea MUCL 33604 TaxID=933084 RepID=A0A067PB74_9AGAM|nr:hypothetical protein JAAARDRAFT_62112 [Jaapia argillacea MUCL 33604]